MFSSKEPMRGTGINGVALSQRSQPNVTDNGDAKRLYKQPSQVENRGLYGQQANASFFVI